MAYIHEIVDLFNGTSLDTNKWFINQPPPPNDPNSSITVSGGNLIISQGTSSISLASINQYNWRDSSFVMGPVVGRFILSINVVTFTNNGSQILIESFFGTPPAPITYNASTMKYFKVTSTSTASTFYYSHNNYNWTTIGVMDHNVPTTYPVQLQVGAAGSTLTLGAINPPANTAPVSEIISPGNLETATTSTPVLSFKATDQDAENVVFEVQMATDFAMTNIHESATSDVGPGFSSGSPYASGATATYTVQTPLTDGAISYFWRVRAKDPAGTNSFGSWTPVQTIISQPNPPAVISGSVSSITATTATAGGEVTDGGGATVTERGIVYGTTANPTTANNKVASGGSTGTFTANLTGLTANTWYNWRAYAINSRSTSYGVNKTFTTLPSSPTITVIRDITDNSAVIDANTPAGGGAAISERGVVYSLSPNPTVADTKIIVAGSSGNYTANLTGLAGITQYYVRAYVINDQGTVYSAQADFTTPQPAGAPTLTTGDAINITPTTADFNGSEVILDGTQPITERGVVFSDTVQTPTVDDRKAVAATGGLGVYNVSMTGLSPETVYYARSYAINSLDVGYGPLKTFTTLSLFIPDEGDGYWTWKPDGSDVTIGRSQATAPYSSANMLLSDLNLENGQTYTLYYSGAESETGEPFVVLQWYDNLVKTQQLITPGVPYTFVYDTSKLSWAIRLFVTGADAEPDPINAIFSDFYLAKEPQFSEFIPFVKKGLAEIRLDNNWILDQRREDTIQSIFDEIEGTGWREFNATTTGLGWIEVGDLFTIVDAEGPKDVIAWETKLTIDGGIKESLSARSPEETETDYSKAGTITKSLKRTQIFVDKNEQLIQSLVEDIHAVDGVVNTKFSEIEQDINGVRTTVQSSGGVNLVKNSVMYAFSDSGEPDHWTVSGAGTLVIQASPESLTGGGISGNVFALSDLSVSQTVTVRKDVDFVSEADKLYYSFSARVRKNTVGTASITLSNRNETWTIPLPDQTEYYWEEVTIEGLLPLDDHYTITITSDADANLQVTDVMLAPGERTHKWTQANGEAMNTNVSITDDGMTIRSNVFRNDYTRIDALGFEVHKHEAGGERVFGFNGDETNVRRLKADNQLSLAQIRMVPIAYDNYIGMAFTRTEEN